MNTTHRSSKTNTVLITGASSGYGLGTARHFHERGWNVIATMRTPREDVLPRSDRLRLLALDVTKPESIARALEQAGPIDALVNNAGIGVVGAFEATPMATAREVFETNTFGVMAMTQAVVPQFSCEALRCDRERNLERHARGHATGRRLHREQDRNRRLHWLLGVRARGLQRARQARRAGLLPSTRFAPNGGERMAGLIPEEYHPSHSPSLPRSRSRPW